MSKLEECAAVGESRVGGGDLPAKRCCVGCHRDRRIIVSPDFSFLVSRQPWLLLLPYSL